MLVADEPPEISAEIIRINDEARSIALQAALLVPLLAGVIGFGLSFRMQQLPDLAPSAAAEGLAFG